MRCDGCDREVIWFWIVDGTPVVFCLTCIRSFVEDAEEALFEERWQRIVEGRP